MKKCYLTPATQVIKMNVENMIASSPFDAPADVEINNGGEAVDAGGSNVLSNERDENFWGDTKW